MRTRSFITAALFVVASLTAGRASAQDADLAVTKTAPAFAAAGSNVGYSLSIINLGPFDATTVSLTDPLPNGMTFVSIVEDTGPTFLCSTPAPGSTGTVQCTIATLPAGSSASFTLVGQIPPGTAAGTDFTNQATVSSDLDPNSENDTGVATTFTPFPPSADIGVLKSGPSAAIPNSDVTYSLTVTNFGAATSGLVTLSDALPGTETFVSFTQDSGPAFSCTTGGTVTCTIAQMNPGDTATFTLVGHIPAATPPGTTFTNVAVVSSGNDPNPENDTAVVVTTSGSANVGITKSGPATAAAGMPISWTVTISNGGPDTGINVGFQDVLPPAATFVSVIQTSGPVANCTSPPPGASGSVNCLVPILGLGASATFTINATVASGAAAGTMTNTATVTEDTADPDLSNNSSSASTAISTQADLALSKTGPAAITAGQNITYTLVVSNGGPSNAQAVSVTDAIPPGATFVSATQTSGTSVFSCTATTLVTCSTATLVNGGSATFSFVFRVGSSASGTISNTASVTTATTDPNPSNNSQTVTTTINAVADMSVVKTGPASMTAGQNATYTIVVTNNGPSDAANVSLSDALPANTTFVSLSQTGSPTFTCSTPAAGATGTITCTAASMINGASATFTLVLNTTITAGTLTNTAVVTSATPDPNAANNTATVVTGVGLPVADLSLVKTASLTNVIPNTTVIYTIAVTNNGPATALGVTVTDTLPATMTFISATSTQGTCSGTTVVTCTPGSVLTGAGVTITIAASAGNTLGATSNTAVVSSTSADPNPANNSGTANVDIVKDIPALSPRMLLLLATLLAVFAWSAIRNH